MPSNHCYWSVATGEYADVMTTCIASARRAGVTDDFYAWTDRDIPGAICLPAGQFNNRGWLFKFIFLKDEVSKLSADFCTYLDADNWFVRNPGDPSRFLQDAPIHAAFEGNLFDPSGLPQWWHYSRSRLIRFWRESGITSSPLYTVNAGLFTVQRTRIPELFHQAELIFALARSQNIAVVDEILLACIAHLYCKTPAQHSIAAHPDFWATDYLGVYSYRTPQNEPFLFGGNLFQTTRALNPAIVHCLKGKQMMIQAAKRLARGESLDLFSPDPILPLPPRSPIHPRLSLDSSHPVSLSSSQ